MSRVLPRLRTPLLLGTGVLMFTCASGWWAWSPSANAATGVTAGLTTVTTLDDDDDDTPDINDLPQLTVRGTARIEKPADEVRLSIGVRTEAEEARAALNSNSTRMNAVITALQRTGLTEDEYETGRFRIRPDYSRRPRNASEDWRPQIVGYTVTNSLDVSTGRLELLGELIAAANEAGANEVNVQGFTLAEPEQYRPEVIAAATRRARSDAVALATAADLELVRILRIEVDAPRSEPRLERGMAMARSAAADATPPIEAGDVTLNATVRIVYEVRGIGVDAGDHGHHEEHGGHD